MNFDILEIRSSYLIYYMSVSKTTSLGFSYTSLTNDQVYSKSSLVKTEGPNPDIMNRYDPVNVH